jgi:parallel beta-helix repeat protein
MSLLVFSSVVPLSTGINVKITGVNEQSSNRGNTLYVGGSGPDNYSSIEEALSHVDKDDTIFIYDDSSPYYTYGFEIPKHGISLIGENRDTTVIIGDAAIKTECWRLKFENLTFKNFDTALLFYGSSNCIITNNIFDSNGIGVKFSGNYIEPDWCEYNVIKKNIFINNSDFGIFFYGYVTDCLIYHNNFYNNYAEASYKHYNYWYTDGSGNYWDNYGEEDIDGDGIGDTPYVIATRNYDVFPLMEPYVGFDPDAPDAPSIVGPNKGKPGVNYKFTFSSEDPNGDEVYYYVTWDDGSYADWLGPYPSGTPVSLNHSWENEDFYAIIARAKDTNGLIGSWGAEPINIPRNRSLFNSYRFMLLERFLTLQNLFSFIILKR